MWPVFDSRQAVQDESDYDALSQSLPRQPPGRSVIAAYGTLGRETRPAATFSTLLSKAR